MSCLKFLSPVGLGEVVDSRVDDIYMLFLLLCCILHIDVKLDIQILLYNRSS